ncbi:hypothetical protein [Paenibacillus sp. UMB4589-SE434]|uniref:hypothetical protein n=1 Tax=Paenibacillus sp. UMB4589-SE434 TaxID=3046314 RepID=UPI002550B73C|nr:hypothetical protein [Paenibacillus sp. UMB4589-SE434]MDK8182048.1 hypothetical protein [Paenibacillus sp. UMB4589-SE434]
MKKIIVLLLLLVVLVPSQAFAAASSSKVNIEKTYFESYKGKVNEVKAAQKNLSVLLCPDVKPLTEQYKASAARYTSLVKSKASKDTLAQAKAEKVRDIKALNAAKKTCSAKVKQHKIESDKALKEINVLKAAIVKNIKTHLAGKDGMSENDFNSSVQKSLSFMYSKFDVLLNSLRSV